MVHSYNCHSCSGHGKLHVNRISVWEHLHEKIVFVLSDGDCLCELGIRSQQSSASSVAVLFPVKRSWIVSVLACLPDTHS